jgi:hypothetical protein
MVKIEKLIPVAGDDFKQYAISQGWIPAPPKRTTRERIALHMTVQEIVEEMSKDGPFTSVNAVAICVDILRYGKSIDLDDLFEGFGSLMTLDTLGIWGDKIRQLHEMCDGNITKLIAVLRAYQLGQLAGVTREKLMHAIANNGEGIDLDAVMLAVKERLPRFNNEFRMPTKQDNGSVVLA